MYVVVDRNIFGANLLLPFVDHGMAVVRREFINPIAAHRQLIWKNVR